MNVNQLVLGAFFPFMVGGILYLLRRAQRPPKFFILWPGFMAAGALWAVIPDLPRLWGAQSLYLRLSRLPICDIFFFHYTIDRIEVYSPVFLLAWVGMAYGLIAAALNALYRAEQNDVTPEEQAPSHEKTGDLNASTAVHFAFGWLVVSLALAPGLWRAWAARRPLGRPLTWWVILSAGSGVWALFPSLSAQMGWMPPGPALNLFWGYGWISQVVGHSNIAGPALLTALLALQYGVIVAGYFRAVLSPKSLTNKYKR